MNNTFLIFLGVFCAMGVSWYGIIFKNFVDFGKQQPQKLATGGVHPAGRAGAANQGQLVYQANGCASCHTMQVRMNGYGSDIKRGWGKRNSALQDYLRDEQVFLGQVRLGPDLANVGSRLPNREFHLLHLYNPQITTPNSLMPQYKYLFEKRKIKGLPSHHALKLAGEYAPPSGYEIVPTAEAEALVTYLLSLEAETPIFEAPIYPPPPKTNEVQAAEAQTTNSSGAANAK